MRGRMKMRIPHVWLRGALLLLLTPTLSRPVWAQSGASSSQLLSQPLSHRNVLADIALQCVLINIETASPIHIEGKGLAPIVAPGLEAGLLEQGYQLTNPSNLGAGRDFVYAVDLAVVDLKRSGRKQVVRTVSLGMSFQIWDRSGEETPENNASGAVLTQSGTCSDVHVDSVDRTLLSSLSYAGFPETNPAQPATGGLRRFLEPAILIGATAVGTYLFFNLRSRRADSG